MAAHDDLPPPTIDEPVEAGTQWITVASDHAGAQVALFRNGVYETSALSRGTQMATPMLAWSAAFSLGEALTANQALCTQVSDMSPAAKVVFPKPKAPLLLNPASGATGLPVSGIQFSWSDPGQNTMAEATNFFLDIKEDGGSIVLQGQTTGTSLTPSMMLDHDTKHVWGVTATNQGGSTKSLGRTFTTKDAPPPPPPQTAALAFLSQLFATYDLVNNLWPVPSGQ
ncbi:hypothetical protein [Litoreibacter janthinus]|uniref:hypothetical protein n=1 Tax=Litoreibacter janthinus TaxID=670154 RepID=UPI0011139251|nr:hypothetical protein [Litoreibacter janthinus]